MLRTGSVVGIALALVVLLHGAVAAPVVPGALHDDRSAEVLEFLRTSVATRGLDGTREWLAHSDPSLALVLPLTVGDEDNNNNTCNQTDPCEHSAATAEYDLPMHVGAVFIMLGVSFLGTVLPFIVHRFRTNRVMDVLLRVGRSFGAGIILATAFIHMLIPAMEALSSECLGPAFHDTYPAFAGLFAMAAALMVQAVEFVSTHILERVMAKTEPGIKLDTVIGSHDHHAAHSVTVPITHADTAEATRAVLGDDDGLEGADRDGAGDEDAIPKAPSVASVPVGTLNPDTVVHAHTHLHAHEDHEHCSHPHPGMASGRVLSSEVPLSLRLRVGVIVLELGIAFHSIIIGIALGVIRGDEFTSLLIALCFHQFFEGFALGATITDADFPSRLPVVFTIVWYSLTTPIGVAIGIALASVYQANAPSTLLVQGILDAVSAGILVYTALVELLSYQITNNLAFRRESRLVQVLCFAGLYVGAGIMAFIGLYA